MATKAKAEGGKPKKSVLKTIFALPLHAPQLDASTMDTDGLEAPQQAADVTPEPQDRFTVGERVGAGTFGVVFRGTRVSDGQEVAIKIIDMASCDDDIDDIHKEISVLQQCECSQLTSYYGSYVFRNQLWIIMEYVAGGSMDGVMEASEFKCFDERIICVIMRELLQGLQYLHGNNKIHRDMKVRPGTGPGAA